MALGAYASLAVVCLASLVIGQTILSLCGRRRLTWLSGPVGLAAILVASGIAIKLPGHGTAVAIALAALVSISLAVLGMAAPGRHRRAPGIHASHRARGQAGAAPYGAARRWRRLSGPARGLRVRPGAALLALAAALLTVAAASIPFAANGRVGILGVGLVNDDMANHLQIADWLNTRVGQMPPLIHQGYPVGPHALVAGLVQALGTGPIGGFAGFALAIPALTALVAFEGLDGVRRLPRVLAAVLVALPYLASAYLAQEAFKEPTEALFVLSFALLLPGATDARRAIPLGVIAAGAVYAYSFPGLFWLAGTLAIFLLLASRGRLFHAISVETSATWAVVGVVLIVLVSPDLGRIVDFTHFRAFKSATIGGGLGNLRHQLSPLEALGIWPASDFRLSASDASGPAGAFYLGALLAAVALALGLPRWIRRHGQAVPAALATAAVVYVGARLFGTVYTSAKALAIAAPLISLISFGGLLGRAPGPGGEAPGPGEEGLGREPGGRTPGGDPGSQATRPAPALHRLLALALGLGIAISSFLVLRQAPVAPRSHADQLAELRPLVQGRDVLFLGRDNFVAYELRGARAFTAVRNYYDPNYVKPDLRLRDVFQKFDFDSVGPRTLARFPYVITTSAAYASGPPPHFRPLRRTPDFVLWRRTGPIGSRTTLAEGADPGAVLDCGRRVGGRRPRSGRAATVFARPPVGGGRWSPSPTVEGGSPVTQSLSLPAGRWQISIQYDATRPLHVTAPGMDATLPANLDYRGSVPYYPAGELRIRHGGPIRFSVSVERPPLIGRLLGTKAEAHLGAIAASPAGRGGPIPGEAERRVAWRHACGRYVDWYR